MGVLQLSAEARERGFGKQRGDDECDHLPALFIVIAAALQESHEMVEGSGLAGADGQAVGIGIVQPHHVEIHTSGIETVSSPGPSGFFMQKTNRREPRKRVR